MGHTSGVDMQHVLQANDGRASWKTVADEARVFISREGRVATNLLVHQHAIQPSNVPLCAYMALSCSSGTGTGRGQAAGQEEGQAGGQAGGPGSGTGRRQAEGHAVTATAAQAVAQVAATALDQSVAQAVAKPVAQAAA